MNNYMDNYMDNYDSYNKKIVYNFVLGDGGISDCIKFFMFVLESCIKNNTQLYYKINNIQIEKYIKLKYDKMYIDENTIKQLDCITIVTPCMFYSTINYNYSININEVFYFTDEVIINSKTLFPKDITNFNYISIHLRLGDKYLETDKNYILCVNDTRDFVEANIYKCIEDNYNKNVFFCCDNNTYKNKIKLKYNNIIITHCDIGHTSLFNTTQKQILDAITEFYILTQSNIIYAGSHSGFSIIASKFINIPLINI